jgi:putative flippase GtrA
MQVIQRYFPLFRQVATFGVVGITGTIVHYSLALMSAQVVHVLLANLVGYSVAVFVSYFGHQRFTFRLTAGEAEHTRRFPKFLLTSLLGLSASQLILLAATEGFGLPPWIALACAVAVVPPVTFISHRYWVFSPATASAPAPDAGPH